MTMRRVVVLALLSATVCMQHASVAASTALDRILRVRYAMNNAKLEQEVEDVNAMLYIASGKTKLERKQQRRLICMPLDERFDPPMGQFSHKHVQTGDKMSLPKCFWEAIQISGAEVPWLFLVKRVDQDENNNNNDEMRQVGSRERVESDRDDEFGSLERLDQVVGGPLDFRAPPNYCFLPWWMMRAMGLQPRDVVDVALVQNTPPGQTVQLRPHSAKFSKNIANPQAVLETELKHYSSLTRGSTIAFDYNKERYWFDVVETRSGPRGDKVAMVKVQDCDVATDFVTSKEELKEKLLKQKQQQADVHE